MGSLKGAVLMRLAKSFPIIPWPAFFDKSRTGSQNAGSTADLSSGYGDQAGDV